MKIISNFSPNHSKKSRLSKDIKFVIIHYTGMQSEIESINRLKNPKYMVSCHYFISRNGQITQLVKDNKVAWHAGKSKWQNFINLNKCSIGIELANKGHQYGYQSFSNNQLKSLIKLCKNLKKKYSIKKETFLGHSDIAPLRKVDPGEKFPWKKLSVHNIGRWYKKENAYLKFEVKKKRELFFKNLKKLGYRYFSIYEKKSTDKKIVKAFQQKYMPKHVTGKIDKKTYKISHFLTI